jgi:hypothetical protein
MKKKKTTKTLAGPKVKTDKRRVNGKSKPRSQRKKPAKPLPEPTVNIKFRIIEAIQEHWKAKGSAPKRIVLPLTGEAELTGLTSADIGDELAGKVWNEGITAFNGKFLGHPFEIRADCEDIRIE